MRITQRIGEGGMYGLSFLLTSMVIGNAFHQKKQFYPAVVYLTKSNPSLAVLAGQALVLVVLLGKLTRKIFFGTLRAAEVEHLIERSWYAVTETCLAFTVFRDDFNTGFVAMFTMLLFFKCFHWLAEDRVDFMERSPLLGCLFHSRILGLMTTLALVDCYFIKEAYLTTLIKGASAQLVFGFEYAILLTIVFTVLVKYLLHCIDLYDENPWENKAVYLLYLELITNGWKFTLYIVFVAIMTKVHTFPLFAIRPLYLTMRSFKRALTDVIMSRRAIRNMNQLYPDATEEDLQAVDDCIICREPMHAQGGCKKLPCSHIFHASCLRSWFQRQQTCPTCRMEILNTPVPPAAPAAPAGQAAPQAAPVPGQAPAAVPPLNPWQGFHGFPAAHAAAAARLQAPVPTQAPADPQQANANVQPPAQVFMPGFPPMFPPNMNQAYAPPGAAAAIGTPVVAGLPPLPFLPFMSMPPPPMPAANIQQLTDEQLRRMEVDEREALEARIQWLRDIQTLLDSAVEQMNQYTLVMSALNASRQPLRPTSHSTPSPSSTLPTQSTNTVEPETLSAAGVPQQPPPRSEDELSGARPKTTSPAAAVTLPPLGTTGATSAADTKTEPRSDQEEVRRRRLAKFQQPQKQEEQQPGS